MASSGLKEPVVVLISGAAGQIGYSLIPLFANGLVLGMDQPLILHLLEIPPALGALEGVAMEIDDGAYPLVQRYVLTADYNEAFANVDYCVLVGGFPRKAGMDRAELLGKNAPIFRAAGEALEAVGKPSTKVLVVANPANTNCLTCATYAPSIPKQNFCALTRLDMNRARSQVASKLGVSVPAVKNVVIWGNHSKSQVPDINNGTVSSEGKEEPLADQDLGDLVEFRTLVQQRGKAIIEKRGLSSAMSAANAVKDCLRDWVLGTPMGQHVAMAVYSDGNPYGIADGIFYSFPCTCVNGEYTIVPPENINVADDIRELMTATQDELLQEKQEALGGN